MATFIGGNTDETIASYFVSPDVVTIDGARPSVAADTIQGGGGNDIVDSGGGNDTVIGGAGNDLASLGSGDDVFVWNPGDGSDIIDGQGGDDTLRFNGSNAGEMVALAAQGTHVRLTRDVGDVALDIHGIEQINLATVGGADQVTVDDLTGTKVHSVAVDLAGTPGGATGDGVTDTVNLLGRPGDNSVKLMLAGGTVTVTGLAEQVTISSSDAGLDSLMIKTFAGNDTLDASALTVPSMKLTLDAGDGDNKVIGSGADDTLITGSGNDVVTGGRGNDIAFLGDGNDIFIWNPGDGSDTVDGGEGSDTLRFNGSNAPENITLSANGAGATLFRDVGDVTMNLNNMEVIQVDAEGGGDTFTINDVTGSGVSNVIVDLAGANTADGGEEPDDVVVNGSGTNDFITIDYQHGAVVVDGLAATVSVVHLGSDTMVVNGLGGDDVIDASALKAGHINLTINGGVGDDTLIGSQGNDTINGGTGGDVAIMGNGNDVFVWNPGDGGDVVDGGAGSDTLRFNGSNVSENITIGADGSHAIMHRDVGNVTMQLDRVEQIALSTVRGADTVAVNDLTGTDVKQIGMDLSANAGSGIGDQQADMVSLIGTAGVDHVTVSANQGALTVSGLAAIVTISAFEPGLDQLQVDAGAGNDVIDLTKMTGDLSGMSFLGGAGDDTFRFASGETNGMTTILDFQAHGATSHGDLISLAEFGDQTFSQAVADGHIAQEAQGAVISDGTHGFALLNGVALGALGAHDFRFS